VHHSSEGRSAKLHRLDVGDKLPVPACTHATNWNILE
jgi:hypothetical protein